MNNCTIIGIDLGDKKHAVVGLDDKANVVLKRWIPNTKADLEALFRRNCRAVFGMETGTHCRWVSALCGQCGCEVYVGNAHHLRSIFGNSHKNDMRDAEEIARLLHGDKRHFHPVQLRDAEHQNLVQLVKMREIVVSQRTKSAYAIRGMAKANGVRLPDSDADSLHKKLAAVVDTLPESMQTLLGPQVGLLEKLCAAIEEYDRAIRDYRNAHFRKECNLLETIPGVGPVNAAAFVAFTGDVTRFRHARDVGPYYGLTAGRDQSSSKDEPKKITKEGNGFVRHLLVNAANLIMQGRGRNTELRQFGLRVWGNRGKVAKRKAKVALARKLAVTMAAMLRSGAPYNGIMEENENGQSNA